MPFRKNVFILGAGFSADSGAPVMGDFLQRAKQLREDPHSGLSESDRGAFGRVFEFLHELRVAQAKMALDLENIEHLFSLAEMELEFGSGGRGDFRQDLIFLILQTLERSIGTSLPRGCRIVVAEDGGRRIANVQTNYGELFAAHASRRWLAGSHGMPLDGHCQDTIITMNYDCFLDDALVRLSVKPDYGIMDATYPEEIATLPFRIGLLKLHGSANWLRCTASCTARVLILGGGPAARLGYPYGDPCPLCGQPREPLIVPPTWAKAGHREMLDPVWGRALRALQEAGRIFIIGYSMPDTDTFFQYMLGLALAKNEGINEVIVVNTNRHVLDKYGRLFQQHFRERRLVPENKSSFNFITAPGFANALGRETEGLDREKIVTSGFELT